MKINLKTLIQIFKWVIKAMFTPGPTTLSGPFGGLPGWRRTSWRTYGPRLETRYPAAIFNRGCGAFKPAAKPPHCPRAAARSK